MSNIHLLPPLSVVSGSSDIKLWRKIKFVGDWIPPRPPQCGDWLDWLLLRWCWWRHWYSCWYLRWWGWRSWRWRWSLKIFFCVCFCWREKWCWCFRARACSWRWSRWGLWRGLWEVRSCGDWDSIGGVGGGDGPGSESMTSENWRRNCLFLSVTQPFPSTLTLWCLGSNLDDWDQFLHLQILRNPNLI